MKLICGACNSPAVLRTNKDGEEFYGCSNYPKCKDGGTISLQALETFKARRSKNSLIHDAGPNHYHENLSKRAKKVMAKVDLKKRIHAELNNKTELIVNMDEIRGKAPPPQPQNPYGLKEKKIHLSGVYEIEGDEIKRVYKSTSQNPTETELGF